MCSSDLLLMSNAQATLRGQCSFGLSVHETVERSNRLLSNSIRRGSFLTLFFGVLDIISGSFKFSNAGHNRPYIRRADGTLETLTLGGLVVGFMPTQTYKEDFFSFNPGDTLYIFSDGVTEAMNSHKELFSPEQLTDTITQSPADVASSLNHIVTTVSRFVGDHPQNDDICMVEIGRAHV